MSQINSLFNEKTLPSHSSEMLELLVKLRDQVNTHFSYERSDLFPHLISHGNKAVKNLTEQCDNDMHAITKEYDVYMSTWHKPSFIQNDPSGCIKEIKHLCGDVTKTIEFERKQLFPLYDRNINF